MKKKFSLTSQLALILLIFVFVVLGFVYLFQSYFLDDFYVNNKIKDMENTSHTIAKSIGKDDLETTLDSLTLSNEVCIRIISKDINITGYNQNNACALRNVDDQMINQWSKEIKSNGGEKLFSDYRYVFSKEEIYDIYIFGELSNDVLILVSSMITPLSATISTIKSQYIVIAAIVIVAALLLSLLISKIILKPIKKISLEINNLPQGQYDSTDIKISNQELSQLNDSLKEANEQIVIADKAKKDLLTNVSHDLRTPLTMIQGYAEMMRDLPSENNEENVNIIIDETKRLSNLVNDLLDMSNYENGHVVLEKHDVSLNAYLSNIYKQYKKFCDMHNVEFKLELLGDLTVSIDEKRISQVIYNFINNALNYNHKNNPSITLGVELINNKYRVYVLDNGDGIDDDQLPQIWERYYKVDKEHQRASMGSGIGLALSKSILEAHKMAYGVESKVGEYSKFYFEVN